ncbi:YcjF family protein [Pseudogemmobacter humi]|uniref:TIGR01620 family protein n=1 Tax=Pseudogemmobacter humi TaxID=2483812 RepID=A0A3P5WYT0_9RHOB|nr:hypothetical protein XINFAN_02118 [Pseudogemmobacter humi]
MSLPPKPFVLNLDEGDQPDPGLAPEVPELSPDGRAMQTVAAVARARPSRLTRAAVWVFGTLFTFVLSVAAWDFVTSLFASNALLGWIAFVLVALAVLFALLLTLREAVGFARLARIDHLREQALAAKAKADLKAARDVADSIAALCARRPEAAWGLRRFAEIRPEVMDADALLVLAETEILAPLDTLARAEVEGAARRVALVTAVVPLALADVAVALYANVTMIRRIATIYGGRAGTLGSWSLLRRVFSSLIATGAVALADDMVGSLAGGGVLSKLSRRFGEGVVNGALTARVGVAAMELCRPLPFLARERPGVSAIVSRALAGLIPRGEG